MTGHLNKLLSSAVLLKLAAIASLALLMLLVSGDIDPTAGRSQSAGNNTCVAKNVSCFNPVNTSTYCQEGTGAIDKNQLTVGCQPDISPGTHPDVVSAFNIGVGPDGAAATADDTNDYNFGGVIAFSPTVPDDTAIPVGAILGELGSQPTLGLVDNGCNNSQLRVPFTFMKGTTDIHDTFDSRPFGETNDLAIMAGDNPPYDGKQDVNPPPAATKYPSFLNAIFDPNWVDYGPDKIAGNADDTYLPGTSPAPIKPVFRALGTTSIGAAGNLWVILQLVVFDKDTKLPTFPALDPAYGYPSVVVLQTSSAVGSATPPAPSAVTDFCSPLKTVNVSFGVTHDNPATAANEGGIPVRTLPDAGTQIPGVSYGASQRDTDGDGIENSLDPCPLNPDTVWDPRGPQPQPADNDPYAGQPVGDGIPDTCDPNPNDASSSVPGGQPTDYDGDGFLNRGDNCTLIANPDQKDTDKNASGEKDGDQIGDACDPNPGTPDGNEIKCIKTSVAVVGGDPNVAFSDCLNDLPPIAGGTVDTSSATGAGGGSAATGAGAGTSASRGSAGGAAAGGVGGPASGVGSLSPVGGSVPAWAAIAAALGAAGVIGSAGTMASRLIKRRRDG
jgi:hypothetical protein